MAAAKQTGGGKQVAPQQPAAGKQVAVLSEHERAQLAKMVEEDAGTGFEEAGREAYSTPFLVVLQDLSPQTKKTKAEYVKGAEAGMIFNTATQRFFAALDDAPGVRFIPCHYSMVVNEWIPRDKGGGFVATHPVNTPLLAQTVREKSKQVLPNGNELQVTAQHFGLLLDPESAQPQGVLLAMKSTQLKYSRRWMTAMKAAPFIEVNGVLKPAAMFDYSYKLGTIEESNDDGTWYSWDITDRQRVVADKSNFTAAEFAIYRIAREFKQAMAAGKAKVDWDSQAVHDKTGGGGTPNDLDNEIPGQ